MKRLIWLLPFALIACSHNKNVKTEGKTETQKAMAAVATKADEGKAEVKKAEAEAGKWTCKHGKDERMLETEVKNDGCELKYTKFGKSHVAAKSAKGMAGCAKIASKIKTNLEKAGFKCE